MSEASENICHETIMAMDELINELSAEIIRLHAKQDALEDHKERLRVENNALRTEVDRLESSPMSEEALDILRSEVKQLRAVINANVPKLITVARMPNQEHVADAHNRALNELFKETR